MQVCTIFEIQDPYVLHIPDVWFVVMSQGPLDFRL